MRMYDVIKKKRDGGILSAEEIDFFISGVVSGEIPDYQISALLMAIYYKGMTDEELSAFTMAMANSGDTIDLSMFGGNTVDKHSTGGVGDKTTLIVAPIVAALGGKIAKMSGRGLGHTGGTADKLEAIDGMKISIPPEEFITQVKDTGICLATQSGNLAPADKKLYALRDTTATVDSIALIASSIMSKKIASGCDNIVLDVKMGSGAFMKTLDESRALARKMVDIGYSVGRNTTAVITNMDIPLGNAIGNALEVKEAVEVLKGRGSEDLREVCIVLAVNMLMLVSDRSEEEARQAVIEVLENGKAFEKFKEVVSCQGGDVAMLDNTDLLTKASIIKEVRAEKDGYISYMDAEKIGISGVILGAGREKLGDSIDYSAGIVLLKKTGDYVHKEDIIAELHTNNADKTETAENVFREALEYSVENIPKPVLVYDIIRK